MSPAGVGLADIQAAAARLQGQVLRTPCVESRTLSEIVGARLFLKFENLQFTASFKERGALNKLLALVAARDAGELELRGVIAASAGNHAQGVAHHAQRLGLHAVIVMPQSTPGVKIERTRGFGAEVLLHGQTFDEAFAHAQRLAKEQGLTFVHPFDDPLVIAGQGTIGLEMLQEQPAIDTLVVAVGGGGMIAGVATAARALRPQLRIVGVQAERFPAMVNAIQGTQHAQGASTIAEGIAVGRPGTLTRAIVARCVDELLLVDEGELEHAVLMLLEIEKTVVEGAGAAGLAALLQHRERFAGREVGLILGGGNIEPLLLAAIIERGMVRAGRLARIRVGARDLPGMLAQISSIVADAGANIDEVHHQRAFSSLAAQGVEIELVLQTRNPEHVAQVVQRLQAHGLQASIY
ncbi:MAG TPA: threonine ammonia-lyase [Rubrivivax sp.]|nr:threonine ammonia-lyase [Burkholderiales bacterium]HNT39724.1 threonine ammonia-lyase [Rubrivivax sp.]